MVSMALYFLFYGVVFSFTFEKVKNQMKQRTSKKVTKKKDDTNKCRGMTVLPYVNGVTEKISRVMVQRGSG